MFVVVKVVVGGDMNELLKKIGEGIFCVVVVGVMGMVLMYTM